MILAMLSLLFTTGCHDVVIVSGGGYRPVILMPPTPELQCVTLAMQKFTAEQQHSAIKQCEEEEDKREAKKEKP